MTKLWRRALLIVVGLPMLGCGGNVGQVKGKVTIDGKPLKGALVTFQPEDGARPSMGRTDDSGQYELVRSEKIKGAAVGKHKVSINTGSESDSENGKPKLIPEKVPTRYNVKSELVTEVKSGRNEIDFDLDSKGEVIGVGSKKPPRPVNSCGGEYEEVDE